jgi:cytochrome c biogenesis protein CcmG, thiol:disulfide interchange protein DsbE
MPLFATADHRLASSDRTFKIIVLVGAVLLLGFIVFVAVRGPSGNHHVPGTASLEVPPPAVLKAGAVAPAFSLPPLRGGAPVSLAAFRGTPVILNFFASWCPHCRAELGAIAAVARQDSGRVAVVGVDSNDTSSAAAARLVASAHATYPIGVDAHAKVASEFLLSALPVTYFLDAQGRVVGAALGQQSVTSLDRWVRRLEVQEK